MPKGIDDDDRRIVDLLIEDGRRSASDIARHLGDLTERSIRYRINRLVADGVIRVTAVVEPRAIGLPVAADVFVEVEPAHIMDAARSIAEHELVTYVACSVGATDLSIQVVAEDTDSLYRFVTETVGRLTGVRKTTTVLLPVILKDDHAWPIPREMTKPTR
jgi:Lrp/AsnC family transcriptional regulator for asnA, asnC and gidA